MRFYLSCLREVNFYITQKIGFKKLDHFSNWAFRKNFDQLRDSRDLVNSWNQGDRYFKIQPGAENKLDVDKMIASYIRIYGDKFDRGMQNFSKRGKDE